MTRVRYVALIVVLMTSTGCFLFHPVSPLAAAARAGDLTAIDNLVAQGADINAGTGVNGWPPVLHAIHKGQTAALVRLLDHGASLSGATRREALLMSSGYGNEPMVRVLLAHGINPRDDGRSGAFVLSEAVRGSRDIDYNWQGCQPHTDVVRVLLARDPGLKLDDSPDAQTARTHARDAGCGELLTMVGK